MTRGTKIKIICYFIKTVNMSSFLDIEIVSKATTERSCEESEFIDATLINIILSFVDKEEARPRRDLSEDWTVKHQQVRQFLDVFSMDLEHITFDIVQELKKTMLTRGTKIIRTLFFTSADGYINNDRHNLIHDFNKTYDNDESFNINLCLKLSLQGNSERYKAFARICINAIK
jgi:hypothetical protein